MSSPKPTFPGYEVGTPNEVQDSPEFRRVLALPRRDWEAAAKENDLYLRMTSAFKLPPGTQTLRLIQASALADAHDQRGLLAPLRVGEGKTLVSFLLPVVLVGIQRPLLIIPAALVEKTWREFKELQKHWLCHQDFMTRERFNKAVLTYEKLGRDSGKDMLAERRPDMIIPDECHHFRNRQAACTRRIERFMIANPDTIFCCMSGTITKRSVRDYWHLAFWALREKMPLPRTEVEMERWADALDERKVDAFSRRSPGVLMQLCTIEERAAVEPKRTVPLGRTQQMPVFQFSEKLVAARKGYQRRLRDSPGVICSPDKNLDCSLVIRRLAVDPGPEVKEHLQVLNDDWTTPNGDLLALPVDVWRHARELAMGFWYKWVPPPPTPWVVARKKWHWFVRQILAPDGELYDDFKMLQLDSPMQVSLAVTQQRITNVDIIEAYREWEQIRPSYKVNVVAEWVSDATVEFCVNWSKTEGDGIIWVEHRAMGEKLAERLNTGFCAAGGVDANGKTIEDYNGKTVVASVAANKEGRNLQAWNRNLITAIMPTGALLEQVIGRTHRMGQLADTVYVDWVAACEEQDKGFQQIMADAKYIQDTTGQSQKLLYADHV